MTRSSGGSGVAAAVDCADPAEPAEPLELAALLPDMFPEPISADDKPISPHEQANEERIQAILAGIPKEHMEIAMGLFGIWLQAIRFRGAEWSGLGRMKQLELSVQLSGEIAQAVPELKHGMPGWRPSKALLEAVGYPTAV